MKKIVLSCLFLVCSVIYVSAQDSVKASHNLNWNKSFKTAKKLAHKKGKPLLIFFTGSDWCGPCKMLVEDVFYSQKFADLADNFVLYEANFPRNTDLVSSEQKVANKNLKAKYNIKSYPTLLILNSKGKEIGRKKGYNLMRDATYHFSFIEAVLK